MTEQRDPLLGSVMGGCRVDERLADGLSGAVYRATQLSLDRPVAIKVLTEFNAGEYQFRERFRRESAILSRLQHPHVVQVIDRGEFEERPYLVMEYVEGRTLRELLATGPLAASEAIRYSRAVLAALGHAHRAGIVHRDVKPENVLVADPDVVKVSDFGLSRFLGLDESTRLTHISMRLGTYEYMSPEQRESAREADARSDLYSAGVLLYEMLTGEVPIGRFPTPSQVRPRECDAALDAVVLKSLEKDPDRRYQTADAMRHALDAAVHGSSSNAAAGDARFATLARVNDAVSLGCFIFAVVLLVPSLFPSIEKGISWVPFVIYGVALHVAARRLREHSPGATTLQAVLAILGAFTVILIPFTLYSIWTIWRAKQA